MTAMEWEKAQVGNNRNHSHLQGATCRENVVCLDGYIDRSCYLSETLAFEWLRVNRLSLPLPTVMHF